MFQLDTDASRALVREHQAGLGRDWQRVSLARPDHVESRRGHRRFRLHWLRTQLRPASHAS
jgi:hypothetical protein